MREKNGQDELIQTSPDVETTKSQEKDARLSWLGTARPGTVRQMTRREQMDRAKFYRDVVGATELADKMEEYALRTTTA